MNEITNTTDIGQLTVLDRPSFIRVAGKNAVDRATCVVESTGNSRALRKILAGEKGAVGKLMVSDTVASGWDTAVKLAASGAGYDTFIGFVALKIKRTLKNNRATFLRLPEIIEDEILQGTSGAKKMSDKAIDELYVLIGKIEQAQARVEAAYQELQALKAADETADAIANAAAPMVTQ